MGEGGQNFSQKFLMLKCMLTSKLSLEITKSTKLTTKNERTASLLRNSKQIFWGISTQNIINPTKTAKFVSGALRGVQTI